MKEAKNLRMPRAGVKSGAMTPAENQATAKLVKNSEYTLASPDSFAIDNILS